jgi:hypothetical protein
MVKAKPRPPQREGSAGISDPPMKQIRFDEGRMILATALDYDNGAE